MQSCALYKVPEGKEGNLVYGSAMLGYGNQWQNLFVQKEKFSLVSASTHVESCADEASKKNAAATRF